MTFHSQDDKTKVPIELTATKKQAAMLMHMEYQVTLPDHEFVAAPKHQLIPSIICDINLAKSKDLTNDAATYSGATYLGIRSAKYLASSALNCSIKYFVENAFFLVTNAPGCSAFNRVECRMVKLSK